MTSASNRTTDVPEPSSDLAVTSVRIERVQLDRFKAVADLHRRSVSQELRWVIDNHIDAHEGEREAA